MEFGNVLVTGGTGFLGAALVRQLIADGNRVRVLDNNLRGSLDRLGSYRDRAEVIEGDVCDTALVHAAADGIDTLFHLAYINGTENFYRHPEKVLSVGVRGALNTLDAAMAAGVRRYVVASSSEVYNEPTRIPTGEDERLMIPDVKNPRFSYGGGKIITELLALHYTAKSPLETIIFRPHNVYGPDMGTGHVIPQLVLRLRDRAASAGGTGSVRLEIQGSGEETRAFCFIEDAVDGIIRCAANGAPGEIYNVGTQDEVSIRELCDVIAAVMGLQISLRAGALAVGGPSRRCPDITALRSLGYEPRWSLRDGVGRTAEWYLDADVAMPGPAEVIR